MAFTKANAKKAISDIAKSGHGSGNLLNIEDFEVDVENNCMTCKETGKRLSKISYVGVCALIDLGIEVKVYSTSYDYATVRWEGQ